MAEPEVDVADLNSIHASIQSLKDRGDWKGLERLFRTLLEKMPSSPVFDAIPELKDEWTTLLWSGLGEVYERLHDDESGLNALEFLCTHMKGATTIDRARLAALYERAMRYDDAIARYEEVLEREPKLVETYKLLFHLHTLVGNVDAAWRAAAALVYMNDAAGRASDFYADHAPRKIPAPLRAPTAAEWHWITHPDAVIPLGQTFRIAEVAVPRRTEPLAGDGAAALVAALPEYRLGDESVATLKSLLFAALEHAGVAPTVADELKAEVATLRAALGVLDPLGAVALREAVDAFRREGKANVTTWAAGVRGSLRRANLLYARDPMRLVGHLEPEDLAHFVSPAHGHARRALGLALAQPA